MAPTEPKRNDKKNVLIFPCGSEIALEINRALSASTHLELFGASSVKSSHGHYVFKNYIDGIAYVDEPNFISDIAKVVTENNIDFFYPAHDSVVLKAAQHQQDIGCCVVGSPAETCRICRSKRLTYEYLKDHINTPKVYEGADQCHNFPVFVKPEESQGSAGTHLTHSKQELHFYLSQNPDSMILEYLPGSEYTVDCFTDRHGRLLFTGARKRVRTRAGISVDTHQVHSKQMEDMAQGIAKTLTFRGPWFFQVKERKNGELVLLEVAPRIAGSSGLYRNLGVNLPLLGILDVMEQDIKILANDFMIKMDRALCDRFMTDIEYKYIYLDFDDCLVSDYQTNTDIIKLIYQCINRDIKVHLFAKDSRDTRNTIKKLHMEGVFDFIHYINEGGDRIDFIKNKPAVYISNSFSERAEVRQKANIPVFAPDAIECLFDWRN